MNLHMLGLVYFSDCMGIRERCMGLLSQIFLKLGTVYTVVLPIRLS